jgi:hypothetical protein
VQVFKPVPRRTSCEHLLAKQNRPLHVKLVGMLDVLLFYMKDEWGGQDMASCTSEMNAAAKKFGGL